MNTAASIALARQRAGVSVPAVATALGISVPAAWDLDAAFPGELGHALSLRQLLRLAATLGLPVSALLPPPAPSLPVSPRPLSELAATVRGFCAAHHLSPEQFAERAGWEVASFLAAPESALDDWCLNGLRDVCDAVDLPWTAFLPTSPAA